MPSDTYTLTISESGVSIPTAHALSHLPAGPDPIQLATAVQAGLMSAAQATTVDEAALLVAMGTTGSGALARATSPTFVTPNLGTPSTLILTNATGLPIVAGTTGTLSAARGGTGTTTSTGTGNVVLSNSPTLSAPNLGTPASGTLTNCSGLPLSSGVTGLLTVTNGGTGASTLTGILVGNGSGAFTAVAQPAGDLVGTSAVQTLTSKTIDATSNTITNISLVSAVTGILPVANGGTGAATHTSGNLLKGNGTGAFTSVAAPSGTIVGTTDTQTLTGKTINGSSNTITNVSLSTGVTGVLPIVNGGTGRSALAYVVADLAGLSPATGMSAVVTNATAATLGTIVAGGGAKMVQCHYDGSDWIITAVIIP